MNIIILCDQTDCVHNVDTQKKYDHFYETRCNSEDGLVIGCIRDGQRQCHSKYPKHSHESVVEDNTDR